MDRALEGKLVAVLEAAGSPLARGQIYARVDADVEDEETLAKTLGRLVASGSLVRSSHRRPEGGEEFVYSVPGASRLDAIADAASAPPPAQEDFPMKDAHDKLVEFLEDADEWLAPGVITERTKGGAATAERLKSLADEGKIQAIGNRRSRRYAALGVTAPEESTPKPAADAPTPEKVPARAKRKRGKRIPCGPAAEAAAQVPARIQDGNGEQFPDVKCAIEDTGAFALNDGKATIRMKPAQIKKVVAFLELTQHVWIHA